jgi:uncharacterized protein YdiU (UPF0061 family)
MHPIDLNLSQQYATELSSLCIPYQPQAATAPAWLHFNQALAEELGLDADHLSGPAGLALFSGQATPSGSQPVAQAYAGHQFGGYSPRLGDGRALLLGEWLTPDQRLVDIALKGSGRTPFARGGDGKAAVGPMLRELIISEAMHGLGIPTTRTLAVVTTGDQVLRKQALPGAVMCRVADSHIRVGTFEYAAFHQPDPAYHKLQTLLDYTLRRHYPEAVTADKSANNPALRLLQLAMDRQAYLISRWMGVGFIHGVMNTDNMTLSGQTIDYGPCAFMEAHVTQAVFSSIDHAGRYAYGKQPHIAQWNLARLAEALLPLIDSDSHQAVELATDALKGFDECYESYWLQEFRSKLGLSGLSHQADGPQDKQLIRDYLILMETYQVDHTLGFRLLGEVLRGNAAPLKGLFAKGSTVLEIWVEKWQERLALEQIPWLETADNMDRHNPLIIPRNHRVEEVLTAASEEGDLQPLERLLKWVRQPYVKADDAWATEPAPVLFTQGYQTFCGT